MCFFPKKVHGPGVCSLESCISKFCKKEGSTRYYLASLPTFSSPSKTNTGTRTHTTNIAQTKHTNARHTQPGGEGRSDAAQIEDSGERKHADCTFLRVRWFPFRLRHGDPWFKLPSRNNLGESSPWPPSRLPAAPRLIGNLE